MLVSVRHVGAHPGEYQHGVSIQISISWLKHFFVYEIFLCPESWRGSLYIYFLSFPRFWTLSIERFWFLLWSILNGVTLKTSNICRVTCIFLIMCSEKMQVKGSQFFSVLRVLKKNSHKSWNMHKASWYSLLSFYLQKIFNRRRWIVLEGFCCYYSDVRFPQHRDKVICRLCITKEVELLKTCIKCHC